MRFRESVRIVCLHEAWQGSVDTKAKYFAPRVKLCLWRSQDYLATLGIRSISVLVGLLSPRGNKIPRLTVVTAVFTNKSGRDLGNKY